MGTEDLVFALLFSLLLELTTIKGVDIDSCDSRWYRRSRFGAILLFGIFRYSEIFAIDFVKYFRASKIAILIVPRNLFNV